MNYKEASLKLINDIKNKINLLDLSEDETNNYLDKINNIISLLNQASDDFRYYELFLQTANIEKDINTIINNNQALIKDNKTNLNQADLSKSIKKTKTKNDYLKLRILSYCVALSIFLTTGMYIISSEKEQKSKKLYLTETYTYLDNTGRTKHSSEYLRANKYLNEVTIKKIMPWITNEKIASRVEYTYKITNMTYNEILQSKDYEAIISNLRYEKTVNTKKINEIKNLVKYTDPIYEVSETFQRGDDYIEKKSIVSAETILALFTELLVYALVININNGPLTESIINSIVEIDANKKIIDSEKQTLKILKQK